MDRPVDRTSSGSVDAGDELPSAEAHYLGEISRSVLLTAEQERAPGQALAEGRQARCLAPRMAQHRVSWRRRRT